MAMDSYGTGDEDPYYQVLIGHTSDFMSNENIVTRQSCLLLTTFLTCIASLIVFLDRDIPSL